MTLLILSALAALAGAFLFLRFLSRRDAQTFDAFAVSAAVDWARSQARKDFPHSVVSDEVFQILAESIASDEDPSWDAEPSDDLHPCARCGGDDEVQSTVWFLGDDGVRQIPAGVRTCTSELVRWSKENEIS